MEFLQQVLKDQYHKQRSHITQHASGGLADRSMLLECLKLTHNMIEQYYHLQYNEKTQRWERTRKPRLRPLTKGKVVELWVCGPATEDDLCLRFQNEMYNQGQGPVPILDTHPSCICHREIVAIPGDRGGLKWAVTRPRKKSRPKLSKTPKQYKTTVNPYDVDNIRQQEAVFA